MSYKFGDLSLLLSNKKPENNVKLIQSEVKFSAQQKVSKKPQKEAKISKDYLNISKDSPKKNKRKRDNETSNISPKKSRKGNNQSPVKKLKKKNQNKAVKQPENISNENEDDSNSEDENAVSEENPPKFVESDEVKMEKNNRTIFVGNWPLKKEKKHLKRHFKQYGTIETVRFRSVPIGDVRIPKKVTAITKQFHPDRTSTNAYVQFTEEASAKRALAANGSIVDEHHLRVTLSTSDGDLDPNKAIFVGNIHFQAEEDDLWKVFADCGDIVSVKIVRDQKTGIGKGMGYVNFVSTDGVELALKMGEVSIKDRPLRIQRIHKKVKKEKQRETKQLTDGKVNNSEAFQRRKQKKNKDYQGMKIKQRMKNKMKKSKPTKRLQKKPFKKPFTKNSS